ncbi:hypothetical protein Psyc_1007 [Psychrobacter arcticus 273-4]|uniref:T4 recombination endonuclease VII dimerisation domain-containing protein n=1 Tax=Psychrobacter arcticus (strain DSM 17307 / VKM B-2377 / 273-4) TaxID=259536 RepID=Q4FSZ8_PSYA2|nr:hypothetical protein [Psychrobacter arcticus]AAZ18860.1 hypothetical protein Psyc_1007 [Psychrobacter arcticus 273-4]
MTKIYIAKNAIGQFNTGEEVVGLVDEDRIKHLLSIGAIVEKDSEEVADEVEEVGEVVKLDKLTKAELIALLEEEGIEYNESDTKAELIALFPKE